MNSLPESAAPEKRLFGRGVVGRHRFPNTQPSSSDIGGRPQMESNGIERSMSMATEQQAKMSERPPIAPASLGGSSDDGRSEAEVPTLVAKLSTAHLDKRDSEVTQTDLSRFGSVQDFSPSQQQHSPVSPADDWVVQTLAATDTGIAVLVKRAKQSMVSGKVR